MFTPTYEGITLKPIYRRGGRGGFAAREFVSGVCALRARRERAAATCRKPWAVSQEIACASPAEFNHAARNSIDRGLNALNMVLDQATRNGHDPDWAQPEDVGCGGLSIATLGDLDRALEGVDLEKTSLFVRSGRVGAALRRVVDGAWRRNAENARAACAAALRWIRWACWRMKAGCRNRSPAPIGKWRR